jgi:hypothetical protein
LLVKRVRAPVFDAAAVVVVVALPVGAVWVAGRDAVVH